MKDHEARPRQKSQSAATMAARTFLRAELGWLRGMPTGQANASGLPWRTLPRLLSPDPALVFHVDRERLRASEFARNTARRRFPKALPRVVGDIEQWTAQTDAQFHVLKRIVHEGAAFPQLAELSSLARLRPSVERDLYKRWALERRLAPVLAALVWVHWHDHADLLATVAALPVRAVLCVLERLEEPLPTALVLSQLAADGAPAELFDLIADARVWDVPCLTPDLAATIGQFRTDQGHDGIIDTRFVTGRPGWPPTQIGLELVHFAEQLQRDDAKTRLRKINLLRLFLTNERIASWQVWWNEAEALERRARHLHGRHRTKMRSQDLDQLALVDAGILRLSLPPSLSWPAVRGAIIDIVETSSAAHADLMHCLEWLATDAPGRELAERFCDRWAGEIRTNPPGIVAKLINAVKRLTSALPDATIEQKSWLINECVPALAVQWFEMSRPHRLLPDVTAVLASLISPPRTLSSPGIPANSYDATWTTLIDAVAAIKKPDVVARALVAYPPEWNKVYGRLWLTLLRTSNDDPEVFARLCAAWPADTLDDNLHGELEHHAQDKMFAELVTACAAHGQVARLVELLRLSMLCRSLGPEALPLAVSQSSLNDDRSWLTAYPKEFRALLSSLADEDPRAQQAIDDILGDEYPSPAKLTEERAALRRMLATSDGPKRATLEKRLARLEDRAASPPELTPRRIANLRAKLERRLLHARMHRLEQTRISALQAGLAGLLGTAPPAEWLGRRDVFDVLVALPPLDARFRRLAFRLLARELSGVSVDLRDEPANRAFVDDLARRGVRMTPWLDGIPPRRLEVTGRTLTLGVDRTPLAVMRMGAHFGTCLAPGNFNFFSAIANAADINKAVIFARDEGGVVQARCLIALGDDGRIITFHVYAHTPSEVLTEGVKEYVEALASAMGTALAPGGPIRTLVSHRWYDDGPNDLTGQLDFLQDGSEFRAALPTVEAEQLLDHVRRCIGAHELTPLIASRIAMCPDIESRPDLILPLLPVVGDANRLEWTWLERLVPLVRRAGDAAAALRLNDALAAKTLRGDFGIYVTVAADEYVELGRPHQALALIRRTRLARVRDWNDESPERAITGAKALRALGRLQRALEVARIAEVKDKWMATPLVHELTAEVAAQK